MNLKNSENKKNGMDLLILVLYLCLLSLLSLIPGKEGPHVIIGIDKLVHFTMYLVLGIIFFIVLNNLKKPESIYKRIILSVCFCTVYGLFIEIVQGFVPGRSPDLFDAAANFAGSFFAPFLTLHYLNEKKGVSTLKRIIKKSFNWFFQKSL